MNILDDSNQTRPTPADVPVTSYTQGVLEVSGTSTYCSKGNRGWFKDKKIRNDRPVDRRMLRGTSCNKRSCKICGPNMIVERADTFLGMFYQQTPWWRPPPIKRRGRDTFIEFVDHDGEHHVKSHCLLCIELGSRACTVHTEATDGVWWIELTVKDWERVRKQVYRTGLHGFKLPTTPGRLALLLDGPLRGAHPLPLPPFLGEDHPPLTKSDGYLWTVGWLAARSPDDHRKVKGLGGWLLPKRQPKGWEWEAHADKDLDIDALADLLAEAGIDGLWRPDDGAPIGVVEWLACEIENEGGRNCLMSGVPEHLRCHACTSSLPVWRLISTLVDYGLAGADIALGKKPASLRNTNKLSLLRDTERESST